MLLPSPIIAQIDELLGVAHDIHYAAIPGAAIKTGALCWNAASLVSPTFRNVPLDTALLQVRALLKSTSLQAYKSIDTWGGLHKTKSHTIVLCRGRTQYDIIRNEQGGFAGYGSDAEAYIFTLKQWHRAYGITILGAGYQTIELLLHRVPTNNHHRLFIDWLLNFCPNVLQAMPEYICDQEELRDAVEENVEENDRIYNSPYFDITDGRIALWWD